MSRALSKRASQKPSQSASKATAMRLIRRPALAASSRHRCSNLSDAVSSTASSSTDGARARHDAGDEPAREAQFDNGDQRAVRIEGVWDRLRSLHFRIWRSIGSHQQRSMQYHRRHPIASPLEVCVRRTPVRAAQPSRGHHLQNLHRRGLVHRGLAVPEMPPLGVASVWSPPERLRRLYGALDPNLALRLRGGSAVESTCRRGSKDNYANNSSSAWALTSYQESVDSPQRAIAGLRSEAASCYRSSRSMIRPPAPPWALAERGVRPKHHGLNKVSARCHVDRARPCGWA